MNKPSWRHHYVPRFYLEGWCHADDEVWVTRLVNGRLVEDSYPPRSTGFREHLYTLKAARFGRASDSDELETDFFAKIDNGGATAMQALMEGGPESLDADQRRSWAVFLNALYERDPLHLDDRDEHAVRIAEQTLSDFLATSTASEEFKERFLASYDGKTHARNLVRQVMVKAIVSPEVLTYFDEMTWIRLSMPHESAPLITSDRPLVVNAGTSRAPISFAWMALSQTELFLLLPKAEKLEKGHEELMRLVVEHHARFLLAARPTCLYSSRRLSQSLKEQALGSLTPWG